MRTLGWMGALVRLFGARGFLLKVRVRAYSPKFWWACRALHAFLLCVRTLFWRGRVPASCRCLQRDKLRRWSWSWKLYGNGPGRGRSSRNKQHLGMMDNPEYASLAVKKLSSYLQSGYVLGKNLVISMESSENPLNQKDVKKIVKEIFWHWLLVLNFVIYGHGKIV